MRQAQLSAALLEILVCPVCYQKVDPGPKDPASEDHASEDRQDTEAHISWLRCRGCGRYYPIEDGIPVMLEARATAEPPAPL